MYIYLDESYNLKDRDKKQFISINGFAVLNEKILFKQWNDYRRRFIKRKKRIHANNKLFDKLREKSLGLIIRQPTATLLSVSQDISMITTHPSKKYFYKNKLNFDQVYFDLVVKLLRHLSGLLRFHRDIRKECPPPDFTLRIYS